MKVCPSHTYATDPNTSTLQLCPGQFDGPNAQGCLQNRLIAGSALAFEPMKNYPSHTYATDPNTSALRQLECPNAQG